MAVKIATRREVVIELPPWTRSTKHLMQSVQSLTRESNWEVIKSMVGSQYFGCGLDLPAQIRLVTPGELFGCGLEFWEVDGVMRTNALESCSDNVPVRAALLFKKIRGKLPPEYLTSMWRIVMPSMHKLVSGEFMMGLGQPSPIYEIDPRQERILGFESCYGGRRSGVMKDEPMMFQVKE